MEGSVLRGILVRHQDALPFGNQIAGEKVPLIRQKRLRWQTIQSQVQRPIPEPCKKILTGFGDECCFNICM